jgi:glycerol-3-phosphate acyltransferase PlsY
MSVAVVGGALIIFMHRANIGRLLKGTESKLK